MDGATLTRFLSGGGAELQGQLQLAVTHPDIRRAQSSEPIEVAFPHEGSATTPPHEQAGFVFRTHQTELFAAVRSAQNIVPQQFFTPMMQLLSLPNPGKSGASFYQTADGSFFFKSVTRPEFKFLESMLPELSNW